MVTVVEHDVDFGCPCPRETGEHTDSPAEASCCSWFDSAAEWPVSEVLFCHYHGCNRGSACNE